MNHLEKIRPYCLAFVCLLLADFNSIQAGMLTAGDFIIVDSYPQSPPYPLREFTTTGSLVQSFSIPAGPSNGGARGIAVDLNGNVQIFTGAYNPYLASFNPVSKTVINNATVSGWTTNSNDTYGGTATYGNYVFVTSMDTSGASTPNGLIRFNVNTYASQRFGSGVANGSGDYIQVAVGKDGLVYAQYPGTSPGGNELDVYNPTTLAYIRTINLSESLRSIAVAANGNIYGVGINDSNIYEFDPNGNLLKTLSTSLGGFTEITLSNEGQLLAAAGGTVLLTNESLSSYTTLNLGTTSEDGTFVAWVEPPVGVPEPSSFVLMSLAGLGFLGVYWLRRGKDARSPLAPSHILFRD